MRAIFIGYRRDDTEAQAGRLFQDLSEAIGADVDFMDVTAIERGIDFRKAICVVPGSRSLAARQRDGLQPLRADAELNRRTPRRPDGQPRMPASQRATASGAASISTTLRREVVPRATRTARLGRPS